MRPQCSFFVEFHNIVHEGLGVDEHHARVGVVDALAVEVVRVVVQTYDAREPGKDADNGRVTRVEERDHLHDQAARTHVHCV